MKTAQPVRVDGRMVLARALCSWSGSDRQVIEIPNHEQAHILGKYRGKQADQERHQKVLYYREVKKLSIRETAEATGYSTSQVCRIQAYHRDKLDFKSISNK